MNGTSLAIIQPEELDTIQRAARLLAVSTYFDGKGDNPQAIAMMATKIMAGREIGIGPFASVNGIHIISGKPAIGANLMAAAIKGSGRYDYRVRELTNDVCKIEFFQRAGDKWEPLGISEFSKADATKAGTKNMDKFPKNMLFARAMSNGVRFYTPDIFSGSAIYVPEELGAEVDGDGNVIDTTYTVSKPPAHNAPETTQKAQGAPEDKLATLRQERLNVEMSDLEHNHEKRELARIDAEIAKHESPPHQRLWGCGMAVLGPDWDMARPWVIKQWTKLETPDNVRKSASDLSNDEKTMLGDYLNKNASAVQQRWPKQKAIMIQATEKAEQGAAQPEPEKVAA